jgi:hypothetical protein
MKKMPPTGITNPGQRKRRVLRLTPDTVRVLQPEALAEAMSGCVTTSWTSDRTQGINLC